MKFQDFAIEANYIGSKTLSIMPWISQSSEIKSIAESFWGSGDRLILTDLVIIYTRSERASLQFL